MQKLRRSRWLLLTYIKPTQVCLIREGFPLIREPNLLASYGCAAICNTWLPRCVQGHSFCIAPPMKEYGSCLAVGPGRKEGVGSWSDSATKCKMPYTLEITFMDVNSGFSRFGPSRVYVLSLYWVLKSLRCKGSPVPLAFPLKALMGTSLLPCSSNVMNPLAGLMKALLLPK